MELRREKCLLVHDKLRVLAIEGNLVTFLARVGCCTANYRRLVEMYTLKSQFYETNWKLLFTAFCSLITHVARSLAWKDCATSKTNGHGIRVLRDEQNKCLHRGDNLQDVLNENIFVFTCIVIPTWLVFRVSCLLYWFWSLERCCQWLNSLFAVCLFQWLGLWRSLRQLTRFNLIQECKGILLPSGTGESFVDHKIVLNNDSTNLIVRGGGDKESFSYPWMGWWLVTGLSPILNMLLPGWREAVRE